MAVSAETLHLRGAVLPDGSIRDVFVVDGRITFTEHPMPGRCSARVG